MNDITRELSRVLISCFTEEMSTDLESKLHSQGYINKKLKQYLGSKQFKEYDKYGDEVWENAWTEFDSNIKNKNKIL
ncbi:hypothetical protein [Paenibacillus sp. Marseille-Q4541]|uniref:hypothetical protein n=1 Tax=Paenibacillus sp. Marseille-Q4541 TaxID=2831522 RepID=UPI001BAB22E8|nr:hypothetical protein [Paenibacillus sp. Marseille-Q4541]